MPHLRKMYCGLPFWSGIGRYAIKTNLLLRLSLRNFELSVFRELPLSLLFNCLQLLLISGNSAFLFWNILRSFFKQHQNGKNRLNLELLSNRRIGQEHSSAKLWFLQKQINSSSCNFINRYKIHSQIPLRRLKNLKNCLLARSFIYLSTHKTKLGIYSLDILKLFGHDIY